MQSEYVLVFTAAATEEEAARLARGLVDAGLAACAHVDAVRSIYRWNGAVHDGPEWRLTVKTRAGRYAEVEQFLKSHHSYETPEIVRTDIADGSPEYLRWIDECVR